jgi:hypothetical protein
MLNTKLSKASEYCQMMAAPDWSRPAKSDSSSDTVLSSNGGRRVAFLAAFALVVAGAVGLGHAVGKHSRHGKEESAPKCTEDLGAEECAVAGCIFTANLPGDDAPESNSTISFFCAQPKQHGHGNRHRGRHGNHHDEQGEHGGEHGEHNDGDDDDDDDHNENMRGNARGRKGHGSGPRGGPGRLLVPALVLFLGLGMLTCMRKHLRVILSDYKKFVCGSACAAAAVVDTAMVQVQVAPAPPVPAKNTI